MVRIKRSWTPRVRYAARKYKRTVRKAQRSFEHMVASGTSEGEAMNALCFDQAQAVLALLNRLGYGGDRKMAPARDRLELELQVHQLDEDVSINFFRLFLAQQRGTPLEQVFSRRGRERSYKDADALRWRHVEELETALNARRAAHAWLSQYYGRFEIGKKYREFTKVQFDQSLDEETKVTYMTLLFVQISQRSGRSSEDILEEYNLMVKALGIDAATAEILMDEGDEDADYVEDPVDDVEAIDGDEG
jgi:hypothetical protein